VHNALTPFAITSFAEVSWEQLGGKLAHIPLDNPALQTLVRANERALLTIAEQPQLAVDNIASTADR
jgi:hypothetical protein